MNINTEICRVESLIKQAVAIKKQMQKAAENTENILAVCEALGVEKIGIGNRDDTFKDSCGFGFGYGGSIFVDGRDKNGWPMAWAVAAKSGFSCGCGNGGQHQISGDFLDGIYIHKNGQWSKQ